MLPQLPPYTHTHTHTHTHTPLTATLNDSKRSKVHEMRAISLSSLSSPVLSSPVRREVQDVWHLRYQDVWHCQCVRIIPSVCACVHVCACVCIVALEQKLELA